MSIFTSCFLSRIDSHVFPNCAFSRYAEICQGLFGTSLLASHFICVDRQEWEKFPKMSKSCGKCELIYLKRRGKTDDLSLPLKMILTSLNLRTDLSHLSIMSKTFRSITQEKTLDKIKWQGANIQISPVHYLPGPVS